MRVFKLSIQLASEEMATETDIADVLEEVAGSIRNFVQSERRICGPQEIYDLDGVTVGDWGIADHIE